MLQQMRPVNCFVSADHFVWVALFVTANLSLGSLFVIDYKYKRSKANWWGVGSVNKEREEKKVILKKEIGSERIKKKEEKKMKKKAE